MGENPQENMQEDIIAAQKAAQHGPRTEHAPTHQSPELVKVIDAWSILSEETRRAILRIVADAEGSKNES